MRPGLTQKWRGHQLNHLSPLPVQFYKHFQDPADWCLDCTVLCNATHKAFIELHMHLENILLKLRYDFVISLQPLCYSQFFCASFSCFLKECLFDQFLQYKKQSTLQRFLQLHILLLKGNSEARILFFVFVKHTQELFKVTWSLYQLQY